MKREISVCKGKKIAENERKPGSAKEKQRKKTEEKIRKCEKEINQGKMAAQKSGNVNWKGSKDTWKHKNWKCEKESYQKRMKEEYVCELEERQ